MEEPNDFPEQERIEVRMRHPCFPQPDSGGLPLWRYMNLAKLVAFLKSQTVYMTRIDQFADPYEGTTTQRTASGIARHLQMTGAAANKAHVLDMYETVREEIFVSCWHGNEHESEAMWRLYCGDGGGVAIQSTYADLVNTIRWQQGVYIGAVSYVDYGTASFPDANVFYPVMHKRASFAHEREVRLVRLFPRSVVPEEMQPFGLPLPVQLGAICKAIFVSPSASQYYFDAVKTVIDSIAPTLVDRLHWSQMSLPPLRGQSTSRAA